MARDSWLKRLIWLRGSPAGGSGASYEKTVGPAPIISVSDAKAKPAKSLIVGMEPIQAGSGDPSPDNIRPITGRTGVTVERTGKNAYPVGEWFRAYDAGINNKVIGDTSVFLRAGTYALSFDYYVDGATSVTSFWRTYSEEVTSVVAAKQMQYYSLGLSTSATSWTSVSQTFTLTKDGWFAIDDGQLRGGVHYKNIQLELGSTASDYSAYSGTTYPVTWQTEAGTVYGGTVDLVSGLLTVTDAQIASYNGETLPSTWISDRDVYAAGTTPTIGAQVVYKLATPQTYQLTPQQIQLLKGANTLWSDADNLTLTYLGTTPANLLGGMLGGGLGGGYNPPAEQDPEELTEPEATETDEPAEETPAEEGENNGE